MGLIVVGKLKYMKDVILYCEIVIFFFRKRIIFSREYY